MNRSLHLKYRPQTLSELAGQKFISQTLIAAIKHQQIAPAYLFAGSRGTGKTSTARILAASLNCLCSKQPTINPCGKCSSCRSIANGNALDVLEIDAASHNGVDDARELIERSSFVATIGRYRVFILDECHMLTNAAQNALLKLLEEPPQRVVFILCTTEQHKVLPTIISRCQTFNYRTISTKTIVTYLSNVVQKEEIEADPKAIFSIARIANGGMRDALQLLEQLSLPRTKITLGDVMEAVGDVPPVELRKLIVSIISGNAIAVLQISQHLIDSGKKAQLILANLLQVYRDLLLVKSTTPNRDSLICSLSIQRLHELALVMSEDVINNSLQQLRQSEQHLKTTVNASIWLEVCLLNLIAIASGAACQCAMRSESFRAIANTDRSTVKSTTNNELKKTWTKIIATTKTNNRSLLSQATLVGLNRRNAILAVDRQHLKVFTRNTQTLSSILSKALGRKVTVAIEERV
jgi:DNA polymerase III subunit gamma/tau